MTDEFEDQADDVQETEGEVLAKEAATDNPFGGYGRPFSDDPLGQSDAYSHDNPANNVGPYSGPNSYSINTVAPYAPPGQDTENPGQNVGPYKRVDPEEIEGEEPEEAVKEGSIHEAYRDWNGKQWFDGSSNSIYARAMEAEHLRRQAASEGDFVLEDEIAEQVDILNKTAVEYDDSSLHESLEDVPGGTVALEYDDLVDGGLVDVTSFLSTGAYKVAKESAEYDWEKFKGEGARQWVAKKIADNPGLIKHEVMCREAAVDYAKDKTMVLMDPSARAEIIDDFVTAAERARREAAAKLTETEEQTRDRKIQIEAAQHNRVAVELADSLENFLPGDYVEIGSDWNEEGYIDIGEDDGSLLYEVARDTIEASRSREWESFTTDGAREWFFSKVLDSPMAKHDDITYRAAKKYALEEAAGVPDVALRNEIARAFTESVEFLRTAHLHREASRPVPEESDIDEFFGDEQLW